MAHDIIHAENARILTDDIKAIEFINEWLSDSPYIAAHTSGSTGTPKPIQLLKSDMKCSANATNRYFGITAESTLFLPLSVDYIAGKMMIVRAIEAGCTLVIEPPSMTPIASNAPHSIDLIPIVPAQIPGLLESPFIKRCKAILVGGSPLTSAQENMLATSGVPAYASYGMTETCSHVALRRIGVNDAFRFLTGFCGMADDCGCLVISSDRMSFGTIATNDIVEFCPDGLFRILGRIDNVIISGGEKIHPEQIEHIIAPLLGSNPFYIAARRSNKWGMEPILVIEGEDDKVNTGAILAGCNDLLPHHHIPKDIYIIKSLPRTASGKIKRESF